ncbi:SMC family protein [Saccharomonospora saliphila]|uniref:ATP-binding protein n=1 Tax=Saccharomonospora saliphila TaxID=369829 RepID=UPI0003826B06|nr:ATP-binding protein [Saccharomonospora saliphila]
MAEWRQQAACAVEAELEHARQAGEWSMLGMLRRTGDGEYLVDLRGCRVRPIEDLRVAGADGPRDGAAVPVGATLTTGVLRLDETGPLPAECDRVWARQGDDGGHLARVAGGLRRMGAAPLADRLAAGELDPADEDAYRTCFLPGVHVVWGPPGSGKTRLAERAAEDLARGGLRVLHVSGDDAATPPPWVEADEERLVLQEDLAALTEVEHELAGLDERLDGYDHDAYLAAERRIENGQRAAALEAEFSRLRERHWELVQESGEAEAKLRAATKARDRVADELARRAEARVLTHRLATVEQRLADVRERLREGGVMYRGRREDRRELRAAEDERVVLVSRIEDCRRRVHTVSDDVRQLDEELAAVRERAEAAQRAEADTRAQLEILRDEIVRLHSAGLADDRDHRYYAECLRLGLPESQARRDALRARSTHRAALRGRFGERLYWAGERLHERRLERTRQRWRSASLVRTTLSQVRARTEPFDVVLVDDAGSARLVDVLFAVAQASTTAVVFGDLAQPWPRVRPRELEEVPEIRRWTLATPLRHCGIHTPADARAHPGCAVLSGQHRFGPAIRTLAEAVGYPAFAAAEGRHTEVVLLDTAGEPVERAAVARLLDREPSAVLAADRQRAGEWLEVLRDTLTVDVGTASTVAGHEFGTVVLDLTGDGWQDRVRAFLCGIARARDRLYLLADLDEVRTASVGTPLGAVEALRAQGDLVVRRLGDLLIPQQRRQPATEWHVSVTGRQPSDGTMTG